MGVVADLINAIMLPGPRDILRRLRSVSLDKTRSKVRGGLEALGRLITAPGLAAGLNIVSAFLGFGFGGDGITGPPSFLFKEPHCSGSREEKLQHM
jgi:hypothetical protein